MRTAAVLTLLCAIGIKAAPAPQDAAIAAPDLNKHNTCAEDGSGIYVGAVIQPCPEGTHCVNNICDSITNPHDMNLAGGAGGAAAASVTQDLAAGASAPTEVNAAAGSGYPGGAAGSGNGNQGGAPPAGQSAVSQTGGAGVADSGAWTSAWSAAETSAAVSATAGTTGTAGAGTGSSSGSGSAPRQFAMSAPECPGQPDSEQFRYVGYWAQFYQGNLTPTSTQFEGITHVILSFAQADGAEWAWVNKADGVPAVFNEQTVKNVRDVVGDSVKIMAAFGGWAQDEEFSIAAASGSMETIANNMVNFVEKNQLDGIDLDWEYPVNFGSAYRETGAVQPNKDYESDAYIELMRLIRAKLPEVVLSAAVPAISDDTIAFTKESVPKMDQCLDFWNLMSYDFINRRSLKSGHHQGGSVIKQTLALYEDKGVSKNRMNFGYGTYAKWWTLAGECSPGNPLDCDLVLGEDEFGVDNGKTGVWKWNEVTNDNIQPDVQAAVQQLLALGDKASFDDDQASAWVDKPNNRFWSWLTAKNIKDSCELYRESAGGVFFWSMNGDTAGPDGGDQIKAMAECVKGAGGSA